MGKDHYNWSKIKAEYVQCEQPISLRDLAVKHDVSSGSILAHSGSEGWVKEREEFWANAASKTNELGAKRLANDRVDYIESLNTAASTLTTAIEGIQRRVIKEAYDADLDQVQVDKILERLSSLAASLERVSRTNDHLEGGPDARVEVSLSNLLD